MINLSGPIRDESLTPDRVTTLEDMAEFRRTANMVVRAATALISVSVAAAHCDCSPSLSSCGAAQRDDHRRHLQ